jgi:hypothetical protein
VQEPDRSGHDAAQPIGALNAEVEFDKTALVQSALSTMQSSLLVYWRLNS